MTPRKGQKRFPVRLEFGATEEMADEIRAVAEDIYEGNSRQTIRKLIELGLAALKEGLYK